MQAISGLRTLPRRANPLYLNTYNSSSAASPRIGLCPTNHRNRHLPRNLLRARVPTDAQPSQLQRAHPDRARARSSKPLIRQKARLRSDMRWVDLKLNWMGAGCLLTNWMPEPRDDTPLQLYYPTNTQHSTTQQLHRITSTPTMVNNSEVPYVPAAHLVSGSLSAAQVITFFEGSYPGCLNHARTH